MGEFYGEIAYEAYRGFTGEKSLVDGKPLPEWYKLPHQICDAWNCAGEAVAEKIRAKEAAP